MVPMFKYSASISILLFFACNSEQPNGIAPFHPVAKKVLSTASPLAYDTTVTTIHVFVALCDNRYQGIVPVPAAIGNGQDPDNNLYWGCGFGIRTYFNNSPQWTLVKKYPVDSIVLQRIVFKHKSANAYLVADAYNGKYIQQCTVDFLESCSGEKKDTLSIGNIRGGIYGHAKLVAYIGHNGLMDFTLTRSFKNRDHRKRDAIILTCISRSYFSPFLSVAKANPLLWTTGLMCPEAYTLHDALQSYLSNTSAESIRNSAAAAYSKFQKCSVKAARNLLVTGW